MLLNLCLYVRRIAAVVKFSHNTEALVSLLRVRRVVVTVNSIMEHARNHRNFLLLCLLILVSFKGKTQDSELGGFSVSVLSGDFNHFGGCGKLVVAPGCLFIALLGAFDGDPAGAHNFLLNDEVFEGSGVNAEDVGEGFSSFHLGWKLLILKLVPNFQKFGCPIRNRHLKRIIFIHRPHSKILDSGELFSKHFSNFLLNFRAIRSPINWHRIHYSLNVSHLDPDRHVLSILVHALSKHVHYSVVCKFVKMGVVPEEG